MYKHHSVIEECDPDRTHTYFHWTHNSYDELPKTWRLVRRCHNLDAARTLAKELRETS
jgi:hypothetical protein